MIVVSLTDCPPKVRGDLSKWLMEINTGVFVGNVSARVRDELWGRICENIRLGRATLVYSSNNEQKMEFRVHNTAWEPKDYDGLTLIKRPSPQRSAKPLKENFSKAAQRQIAERTARATARRLESNVYVAVDIETTGLSKTEDEIIEVAAVRMKDGAEVGYYTSLINASKAIPKAITELTGITDEMCAEGKKTEEVMRELADFIGKDRMVCHNMTFDIPFLQRVMRSCGVKLLSGTCSDTLRMAKRSMENMPDYKLETVARALNIVVEESHRALSDCRTTAAVYEKLNVR